MDIAERNTLVLQYVPLAWQLAIRVYGRCPLLRKAMELEDVAQEACVYLIESAERFDPFKPSPRTGEPVAFITYAHERIRCKLLTLAKECGLIKVERNVVTEVQKWKDPEDEAWSRRVAAARAMLSYRQLPVDKRGHEVEQEDKSYYDVSDREREEIRTNLAAALARLGGRDRDILERRYGLKGPPETLEEIGIGWGLSKERVRQLQKKATAELKDCLPPSAADW